MRQEAPPNPRSWSRDEGQTSTEYLGVLVVVALLVGALAMSGGPVGRAVADGLVSAVCRVSGGDCGVAGSAGDGSPPPRVVGSPDVGPAGLARTGGDPPGGGSPAGEDPAEQPVQLADLPEDATPDVVAAFFADLGEDERQRLLAEDPERIGALDGAPLELRYAANALLIDRAAGDARAEVVRLEEALAAVPWWNPLLERSLRSQLARAERRTAQFETWAASDRRFLLFDPAGDGRVAEVLGDLDAAEHVTYLVPGVGSTIDTFDTDARVYGERLLDEITESAPGEATATVVWLGYDPPERVASLAAARADRAEAAARDLPGFVEGVGVQTGAAHVSVLGHSYGSVAASLAAQADLEVDTIVLIGSPGARAGSAEDLGGAEVWAGLTPDDPIRHVPNVGIGGTGHGTDPTSDDFGALVFDTGTARGHSGYLDRGTLSAANIAAIVTGQPDQVVLRP